MHTLASATPFVVTSVTHEIDTPLVLTGSGAFSLNASTGLILGSVSLSGNAFSSTGDGALVTGALTNTPSIAISGNGSTTTGSATLSGALTMGGSGTNAVGAITGASSVSVTSGNDTIASLTN